jgi:large subunit ribosomal protein L3
MLGIVGTKVGMTRVFKDDGKSVPVTVVQVSKSKIVQRKTQEKDGYFGIQVNYGSRKNVSKSNEKKFKDNGIDNGYLTEFNLTEDEFNSISNFDEVTLEFFNETEKVDVSGVSKGKGFAGVVKRHNFKTQDATHGNSLSHRAPGSIGQCQFPGRVFKGKKMAGHYGSAKTTVQSLDVARIDLEDNLILIKGAIPGSIGSFVKITPSIKGGHSFTVPAPVAEEATAPVDAPLEEAAAPVEAAAAPVEAAAAPAEAAAAPAEEAVAPAEEAVAPAEAAAAPAEEAAAPVEEAKEEAPAEEAAEEKKEEDK